MKIHEGAGLDLHGPSWWKSGERYCQLPYIELGTMKYRTPNWV